MRLRINQIVGDILSKILVLLFAAGAFFLPDLMVAQAQELDAQRQRNIDELEILKSEISLSEQRRAALRSSIEALDKDRATVNRNLIDASSKARGLEKKISKAEGRLSQLRDEQAEIRIFLNSKRGVLAEVLGALQRMGRKPPPALLVTPEDALSSVRSAILLGSVVPEMRSETELLVSQLQDLTRISNDIESQRASLTQDLEGLAAEEERLNLLLAEKSKLSGVAQAKLAQESAKAAELAAKATSLNGLISDLENQIEAVQKAAEAARIAEEKRKAEEQDRIFAAREVQKSDAFADTGRIAPAISFEAAKGLLPLPVAGLQLAGFGEDDGAGDVTNGVSLETRENTRVIAPADSWILYAGPFRSYGQLLIMNAGQGYHVVLAGMDKINVQPGQFVLVGEPVGTMGSQRVASTGVVDINSTNPILYVEFRKDGKSIDPAPWWSVNNGERASNGS
ncbi:MAG: peptidoglycan DD-metalloendopeptidase family protein [Pseudomonadota bacterium]